MKSTKTRIKAACPYCHRIEVHKNLEIGDIVAVRDCYYFADIQCGKCGSKYDLRMDFYSSTQRQQAEEREKRRIAKKNKK